MKLTKEFILLQGFKFQQTHDGCIHVFSHHNQITNDIYELVWDEEENNMYIAKYDDKSEDDNAEPIDIYDDKIYTCFNLVKILVHHKEITNKQVSFHNEFVEDFMASNYPYNEMEFNEMCDASLLILLAKEEYEKCQPFLQFRKDYINKRGWEYKEMENTKFKDYSKITTKSIII